MTQRFSFYEDLSDRARTSTSSRACTRVPRRARRRSTRALERLGLGDAPEPARRHAVRRLEAAPGAGRVPACTSRELLLLDEPTAGVDPEGAARVLGRRSTRSPPTGMTVLVTTHYMDEAERCHGSPTSPTASCWRTARVAEVIDAAGARDLGGQRAEAARDAARGAANAPGVAMAAPFGNALHVSGTDDGGARRRRSRPFASDPELRWQRDGAEARGRVHLPDGAARSGRT